MAATPPLYAVDSRGEECGAALFCQPQDLPARCLARHHHGADHHCCRRSCKFTVFVNFTWLNKLEADETGVQVWVAPHTHDRLFPITFFDGSGDIVYAQFAYPYIEPIFSAIGAGLVAGLVPLGVFLFAQIWVRDTFDFLHAVLGLVYSLATGTLFQVVLKKTIGGLRPHFLTVCEPVIPNDQSAGHGFQGIMFHVSEICTGDADKIANAIESFPSGHSNIAWAGLGYLAIYLFTHLRIQSLRRRASYWKMGFVFLPVLLATYLASTLVLGYHHHGYDVIFGSLIGIVMALFSYRMVFCSIRDPRWNTVPRRRFERDDRRDARGSLGGVGDEEARTGDVTGMRGPTMSKPTTLAAERVSSSDTMTERDGRVQGATAA